MRLDDLWQFMQVDMEADRFESKMRQSENRQKLLKQRNFLMEQQSEHEEDRERISPRCRIAWKPCNDEAQRLEKQLLTALTAEIEAESLRRVSKMRNKSIQAMEKMNGYAFALRAGAFENPQGQRNPRSPAEGDPRSRRHGTKVEYDQLKAGLRQGIQGRTLAQAGSSCRAGIETKAAQTVDPALLERYRAIKQHCTPPMAKSRRRSVRRMLYGAAERDAAQAQGRRRHGGMR